MKPEVKILSIDGGGIRGIIPCMILSYISSQMGGAISEYFDLITGTSTGGIIGLGLTSNKPDSEENYSPEEMLNLYKNNGDIIFNKRQSDFLSKIGALFGSAAANASQKPYNSEPLEKLLKEYFGDSRLKSATSDLLITTYDIKEGRPFYFSSRLARKNAKEDFSIMEVARSTSAAPTYFEPNLIKREADQQLAFVDGGVFANNPAILAYAEAKEIYKNKFKNTLTKGNDPVVMASDNDFPFFMLSIGTGNYKESISAGDAKKWRTINWLKPMLSHVFMQSASESVDYTMQHLLPPYSNGEKRYHRIQIDIPEVNSQMDDSSPENVDKLCSLAQEYIDQNESSLLEICEILR